MKRNLKLKLIYIEDLHRNGLNLAKKQR